MLEWLGQNGATIVVGAIVFGVIAMIIYKMIKDKKSGKKGCGCGCGGCSMKDICHQEKEEK